MRSATLEAGRSQGSVGGYNFCEQITGGAGGWSSPLAYEFSGHDSGRNAREDTLRECLLE